MNLSYKIARVTIKTIRKGKHAKYFQRMTHFYDSSAALFLSKHILEVSSAGCAPQCVRDSLGFG